MRRKSRRGASSPSSKSPRRRPALSAAGWIDVSIPLRNGMVHWPGDPPFRSERIHDMERGEVCNVSALSLGSHTGTHMDPPLHFIRGGRGIDEMPLSATIGPARVIPIEDPESVKPGELRLHRIRRGERVLFRTRNSERCWRTSDFVEDFVHISKEAAQYLAGRRVRAVGVDYLSVGGYMRDGVEAHQALLGAGIWLIEGLDLSRVRPGEYELICLPIRSQGGDGAPARVILRRIHSGGRRK